MEEFKDDDEVDTLNCNEAHVFHHHCIEGWLKTQTEKNQKLTCPTCRSEVKDEMPNQKEGGEAEIEI